MDSQKRIKLVQIIADGDFGGGASHVLGLLRHIDRARFDCYLICPPGDLARQARDIPDVEVIDLEMASKYDLIARYRLGQILSNIQAKYDPFGPMIVHSHGPRAGLIGRLASPLGAYRIYTEHIWTDEYHLQNRINEWIQLYYLRLLNRKTDAIIAVSSAVKRFLVMKRLASASRIKLIPNGIDIEEMKAVSQKKKQKVHENHFIIGTVGSLNHQKGQIYLIEAMAEVAKKYPHVMCEIVGEGEERPELEAKISELDLGKNVSLLGRREDPAQVMAKWSVFVLPSLSETFGIVILEAFAALLPVIATKVGGIPDIIKDGKNGVLVEPESPLSLAEKIVGLKERPALREAMVRESKKTLEKYSWGKIIEEIEKVYLDVIK